MKYLHIILKKVFSELAGAGCENKRKHRIGRGLEEHRPSYPMLKRIHNETEKFKAGEVEGRTPDTE